MFSHRTLVLGLASALTLAACSSSSSTPSTPPAGPQRVYTSIKNTPGTIHIYALPLTNSSVSTSSFAGFGTPTGMCVDGQHRLYVVNNGPDSIAVYNQPITSGATPAFTLSGFGGVDIHDCAIDASSNLYVADDNGSLWVFKGPVSSSSTVDHSITTGISSPFGVAVDATGDVFASNTSNVTEYSSFGSGNGLLATFGSILNNWGLHVGPDGNLYVANGTANGEIDVYKPPFSNASTPDHSLTIPGAPVVLYMAFDNSGNMYISGNTTTSLLWELAPPYTGAPVATVTVDGTTSTSGGVAADQ
jgi:hypothetical protein